MKHNRKRLICMIAVLCLILGGQRLLLQEAKAASYNYISSASVSEIARLAIEAKNSGKTASYFDGQSGGSHCAWFAYGYCVKNAVAGDGLNMPIYGIPEYGINYLLQNNYGTLFIKCSDYHKQYEQNVYNHFVTKSGCGGANVVIADSSNFRGPTAGDLVLMAWTKPSQNHYDHVAVMVNSTECVYASGNTLYRNPMSAIVYGKDSNGNLSQFQDGINHQYGDGILAYFRFNTTPVTYGAPEVHATACGTIVHVSWADTGANSYYVYAVNTDTGTTIEGENIGRQLKYRYEFAQGNYRIYVTAVYSADNMKTGCTESDVKCEELQALQVKGEGGQFVTGEKIKLYLNTTAFTSADLLIYRTPTGGDPYEYWRENVNPNTYMACFSEEGFYSCCYAVSFGYVDYPAETEYIASKWIGWSVNKLQAQHTKGSGGYYTTGESVKLGLNTNAFTRANLQIVRTPPGGTIGMDADSYLYWQGEVNPNTFSRSFDQEGYYSCGFVAYDENSNTYASQWIDWNVIALQAQHPKGSEGYYELNEPVKLSLNTDVFSLANASIVRTPPGGTSGLDADSYYYWQGEVNPNTFEKSFDQEGYYSCGFVVYDENSNAIASKWMAWNVYSSTHINYNPNGGNSEISSQMKEYNVPLLLSDVIPVRAGYDFLGWATTADATAAEYQPGDSFTETGDYTLYAVWQAVAPDFILPAGTTTVEDYAFQGCAFTYVRLSDETTTLGNGAFADCPNLKHVYMPQKTVIIGSNVFPAGVTIHGKDGSYAEFYANKNGFDFIAE